MARQNKQWKESGVRLGHSPTYIMWDYILPPRNLWSCPSLHLRFPSFLKCRPFLLWKISQHTCSYFTLPRAWFCPLSLYPCILGSVPLSCKHVRLFPPTHKNTPSLFTFLSSYCSILATLFKRNSCMNSDFMSLPALCSHPPAWFSVPSCTAQPVPSRHVCAGMSRGPFSLLILGEPSCIDLTDQSFLLETPSASLLCPHRLLFLRAFSPQSFLLVPHPLQPWSRSSLHLDLCLSFLLIHTPMIVPTVLISNIIHMPSPVYICKLKPFFWTPYTDIHLLTWYVLWISHRHFKLDRNNFILPEAYLPLENSLYSSPFQ